MDSTTTGLPQLNIGTALNPSYSTATPNPNFTLSQNNMTLPLGSLSTGGSTSIPAGISQPNTNYNPLTANSYGILGTPGSTTYNTSPNFSIPTTITQNPITNPSPVNSSPQSVLDNIKTQALAIQQQLNTLPPSQNARVQASPDLTDLNTNSNLSTFQNPTTYTDLLSSIKANQDAYLQAAQVSQQEQDAEQQLLQAVQGQQTLGTQVLGNQLSWYGRGIPLSLAQSQYQNTGFGAQVAQLQAQNAVQIAQQNLQFQQGNRQVNAQALGNLLSNQTTLAGQQLQSQLAQLPYSNLSADQKLALQLQYFQATGQFPNFSSSPPSTTATSLGTNPTSSTIPLQSGNSVLGYDMGNYATDPNYTAELTSTISQIPNTVTTPNSIQSYINSVSPNSPITGQMVYNASTTYGVDPRMLLGVMQHESTFGTKGEAVSTFNPGNVGNTDSGATVNMGNWQTGINSLAQNLAGRFVGNSTQAQSQPQQLTYQTLQKLLPTPLSAPGVLNVLSDGTPYFQSSKIPSQFQVLANNLSSQYQIPVLSDDQVQKAQNIDTLTQKINQMVPLVSQTLGSGAGGKITNTLSTWWNNVFGTNQGINQLDSYNTAAISAIENIVGGSGSGVRVTGAEINLANSLVPNSTDTLEQAQTKLASLQSQINEWRNEYFSSQPVPDSFGQIQTNIQNQTAPPQQVQYQGQTYNVDPQGNMTLAQ